MKNYVITRIVFQGRDSQKLYQDIKDWISVNRFPNQYGKNWLGNILYGSGLTVDPNDGQYKNNGEILEINDYEDEGLEIVEGTQNRPLVKMWYDIMKAKNYDVNLSYWAVNDENKIYEEYSEYESIYHVEAYDPNGLEISDDYWESELNALIKDLSRDYDIAYEDDESFVKEMNKIVDRFELIKYKKIKPEDQD